MALSLPTCVALVASILNSTRNGYNDFSTKVDPLHLEAEITAAVLAAARGVSMVIFDTPGHRLRNKLLEMRAASNGVEFGGPIGAVNIDGSEGVKLLPGKFKIKKANYNSIGYTGYYTTNGQVIWFLGTTCTVETLKTITSADTDVLEESFQPVVVTGALHLVFAKMGTNVEASANYGQSYQAMLQMIRQGGTVFPAMTGNQQPASNGGG